MPSLWNDTWRMANSGSRTASPKPFHAAVAAPGRARLTVARTRAARGSVAGNMAWISEIGRLAVEGELLTVRAPPSAAAAALGPALSAMEAIGASRPRVILRTLAAPPRRPRARCDRRPGAAREPHCTGAAAHEDGHVVRGRRLESAQEAATRHALPRPRGQQDDHARRARRRAGEPPTGRAGHRCARPIFTGLHDDASPQRSSWPSSVLSTQ